MASPFPEGAAAIARRFGVTVKTLRVYEEAGLIRPVRNGHGWRTYGQAECERLHLVLLLRRFGLTIARIAYAHEGGAFEQSVEADATTLAARRSVRLAFQGRMEEAFSGNRSICVLS